MIPKLVVPDDDSGHLYIGTHYYQSLVAANSFYNGNVEAALREGRIEIGKPNLQSDETLFWRRGRAFIRTPDRMAAR